EALVEGKIGLVVGLGVGYVLGSRAGRERYEQIKAQWLKVWNREPVQFRVAQVQDFAKAQVAAVPGALWNGAVKGVKAAADSGTTEQRLHAAVDTAKDAAEDVADAAKDAAAEAKRKTASRSSSSKPASGASASETSSKSGAKKTGTGAE